MELQHWEGTTFDADGLTGERLNFIDRYGFTKATVVVWPGRQTRVYWAGGAIQDFRNPGGRAAAVRAVETLHGLVTG